MYFIIIIIGLAAWWLVDELIAAPTAIFDEEGRFSGWEKPTYSGLFDLAKKKIKKIIKH